VDVDVVVLAGGRSTRFGTDKVELLLDEVLGGLPEVTSVVCVGPERETVRTGVRWVREDPPYSGPLAAVSAGVAVGAGAGGAGGAPIVVLLGADMPRAGAAVADLVSAVGAGNGAVLVDADGWPQVLASAWRRTVLAERLAGFGALEGRPLRLLLDGASLVPVPDVWGAARDIDTPGDL
jgi:molybdopterin-guanine dinucleotide biosynthesis protein A